jgi:hypothetical protein
LPSYAHAGLGVHNGAAGGRAALLQKVAFKGIRFNKRPAHVRKILAWSNFDNV